MGYGQEKWCMSVISQATLGDREQKGPLGFYQGIEIAAALSVITDEPCEKLEEASPEIRASWTPTSATWPALTTSQLAIAPRRASIAACPVCSGQAICRYNLCSTFPIGTGITLNGRVHASESRSTARTSQSILVSFPALPRW